MSGIQPVWSRWGAPAPGPTPAPARRADPADSLGTGDDARTTRLDPVAIIGAGSAAGLAAGAMIGAIHALGSGLAPMQRSEAGAALGMVLGLTAGAGLVLADQRSDGGVTRAVPPLSMFTRNQLYVLARHPLHPMLGVAALRAASEAVRARGEAYGKSTIPDAGDDAFRHAYGSALLATRLMRSGTRNTTAARMTLEIGMAHEDDATRDPANLPRRMDLHNDEIGVELAGNGRDSFGHWLDGAQLQARVYAAMASGQLNVIEHGANDALRESTSADLPLGARG